MSEIPEKLEFLTDFNEYDVNLFVNEKQKTSIELAKEILPEIKEVLAGLDEFTNANLFETLVGLSAKLGIKKQALLWIARIAITGRSATAGGATEIAEVLGKEQTISRIDFSLNLLNK